MALILRSLKHLSLRRIGLLLALDTRFGTLWWVREELWMREFRSYVDAGRKGHPGVSLRDDSDADCSLIPLLHGRSHRHGSKVVMIRGISRRRPKRPTYFGHIGRPAQIPASKFGAERLDDDETKHEPPEVTRIAHKPRTNKKEEEALREWWVEKQKQIATRGKA